MNGKLLLVLGGLGLLLAAGSSKAAEGPEGSLPPLPPPPPPPPPRSPTRSTTVSPPRIIQPAPADVTFPPGWIPTRLTPELSQAVHDIVQLGDPPGTVYPFTLGDKKYAAMVTPTAVVILQPEDQI